MSIAREIGSNVRDLKGHCAAKRILVVLVQNPYDEARQMLVRTKDRNAVSSFRPVLVLNKPQTANKKHSSRAVSSPIDRAAMEFTTLAG